MISNLEKKVRTTQRFKFDLSAQQALDLLTQAYINLVDGRFGKVVMDEYTQRSLIAMAEALTAEEPKFGLWLYGEPGNGKTTLMRAFMQVFHFLKDRRHFAFMGEYWKPVLRFKTAKEIVDIRKEKPRDFYDLAEEYVLCIDDVGTEPAEIQDFGNIITPMVDLLLVRYDMRLFTIVTSNIAPEKIKERYGARISDRCREMFVPIRFNGPTYRFK